MANLDLFIRANVGLLTIDLAGHVSVVHQAEPDRPYCDQLAARLTELLIEDLETNA